MDSLLLLGQLSPDARHDPRVVDGFISGDQRQCQHAGGPYYKAVPRVGEQVSFDRDGGVYDGQINRLKDERRRSEERTFAVQPDERRSACESSESRTTDRPGLRRRPRCRLSPPTLQAPAQRKSIAGLSPANTRRQRASRREPSRSSEVMSGEHTRLLEILPRQIRELRQRSCECPSLARLNHAQMGARRDAKTL